MVKEQEIRRDKFQPIPFEQQLPTNYTVIKQANILVRAKVKTLLGNVV